MTGFDDIIVTKTEDTEDKEAEEVKDNGINAGKSVHVAFVMDHSGSMTIQSKVALENFNEQLGTLKRNSVDIDTFVSVIEFDDRIFVKCKDKLIDNIKLAKDYWTNGTTSLNDAIFKGITLLKEGMKNDPLKDKTALMIIMTDGFENSSKEFAGNKGRDLVKKKIKKLEDTNLWTFTFMGAGIDVQDIAVKGYGMKLGNTISFSNDYDGYKMSNSSNKRGMNSYYVSRNVAVAGTVCTDSFHNHNTAGTEGQKVTSSTVKEEEK